MTTKYGNAIQTIRTYPSRISGASADVSRNRNAAWPFGVATLGMLVPVLIATPGFELLAGRSRPAERRLDLGDVDRRDEHVVADRRERAVRDVEHRGLRAALERSTPSITGANRCWSWITATIAKNTTSSAVNGRASSNALPSRCSSVMPLNAVASTMTSRPIRPTSATWKASDEHEERPRPLLHDQDLPVARRGARRALVVHAPAARRGLAGARRHSRTSAAARSASRWRSRRPAPARERAPSRRKNCAEVPPGLLGDQQVLRLAHQRGDAAERRADRGVHHQAAQERAELLERPRDAAPARLRRGDGSCSSSWRLPEATR